MTYRRLFLTIASVLLLSTGTAFSADEGIQYFINNPNPQLSAKVPSPYQVLGYNIGECYPDWGNVLLYMESLVKASDRTAIKYFGRSYQRRPFVQLCISSPENIRNLESIRERHLKVISDIKEGKAADAGNLPVVVDLMASIHGNEASGVGAAINAAYYFTASNDPEVVKMLENTIIIITPGLNPDGINRFATWVNTTASVHSVANLDSREFSEPWPSSRTNHYWADCNRDWMSIQHPEGENDMIMYRYWMPNVVLDMHEQGDTQSGFYFSPGDPGRTYRYIPQKNQDYTLEISRNTARALDQKGTLYFSREGYDDFFIGKGAAYGDILGSVCILHEQGASRGHLRPTKNGMLSYKATVRNQTVAAISVAESAYMMKDKLLSYRKDFYSKQEKDAAADPVKAFQFTAPDNGTGCHFIDLMLKHGINVYENAASDGSYVIPFAGNNYYLIRAFFDNETSFADSTFYDVSTWTHAHAFNLKVRNLSSVKGKIGKKVESAQLKAGSVIGKVSSVGYAFETKEFPAPYVVNKLMARGLVTRVSDRAFNYKFNGFEKEFSAGTVVIPVANQPLDAEQIHSLMTELARKSGVDIYSLQTGMMGDKDLGSDIFMNITAPEIAIIAGRGMSVPQTGEIWHHLDVRYDMAHTLIDYSTLEKVNLSKYNVIVLADGQPSSLTPEGWLEKLNSWVKAGGTLIVTGKAYHISNKAKLTDVKYERVGSADGLIVNADIRGKRSPLGWGLGVQSMPVYKMHAYRYSSENGYALLKYAKEPYISGCVAKSALEKFAGTPAALLFEEGRGRVIFFADDMVWRSYWLGSSRILTNAILFRECL